MDCAGTFDLVWPDPSTEAGGAALQPPYSFPGELGWLLINAAGPDVIRIGGP